MDNMIMVHIQGVKSKEKLEEKMAILLTEMMQYEREIRVGKEAERKLNECRKQLKQLTKIYNEGEF